MRTLSISTVLIILHFGETHEKQPEAIAEAELRSFLPVSVDKETKTIHISFHDPFFGGFRNPKNMAERVLVRALTMGVLTLSGEQPTENKLDSIVSQIVPNENARYVHFFDASHFRDFIQEHHRPEKLFSDDIDEARSKLGLGWLVRDRKEGDRLMTANESVPFLNNVVDAVWKGMRTKLQKLDRGSLLERALRYIEGIEVDKTRWQRTVLAVLSLRQDRDASKGVAMQQIARCNAAAIALRLVIEMAVSECPLEGGRPTGALDLTPLMCDALTLFHIGGWSDAINKGVMEPEIHIAPSGDVRSHVGFRHEIVEPLGQKFGSARLDHEASIYDKHFEPPVAVPSVEGIFPDAFLVAFEAEFGLSVDAIRRFAEALENLALEKEKCVFVARDDEILSYCERSQLASAEVGAVALDHFSLWPREAWDKTPNGFRERTGILGGSDAGFH